MIHLSVILPFFRKLEEFARVLPMNAKFFASAACEVVLVLDECSEEDGVLDLIAGYPTVRWRVLVNRRPHGWRPPCRAINVGIRHAMGEYVLVCSPESAWVVDFASILQTLWEHEPEACILGQVRFATFRQLTRNGSSKWRTFHGGWPRNKQLYYGSMAAPTRLIRNIRGYDESFRSWGGDDDNIRIRLAKSGARVFACARLKMLHLSAVDREKDPSRGSSGRLSSEALRRRLSPKRARANDTHWGRSFDAVRIDWAKRGK